MVSKGVLRRKWNEWYLREMVCEQERKSFAILLF